MGDSKLYLRLRELREQHGYTQEKLAEKLNVNPQAVKSWEKYKNPSDPKLKNLLAMCNLYHCDLDYLTGRIKERTHDLKTACELTGLSEAALEKIVCPELNYPFSKTLSRMIESNRFENLITNFRIYFEFLSKLKATDLDDQLPWYELNGDNVVLGINQALNHFKHEVSNAMEHLCDDTYFQQASQTLQEIEGPFSVTVEPGRVSIHRGKND